MELFLVNRLQHGLPNEINKNNRSQKNKHKLGKSDAIYFRKTRKIFATIFFLYLFYESPPRQLSEERLT